MSIRNISKVMLTMNFNSNLVAKLSRMTMCGCQRVYFSEKPINRVIIDVDPETGEQKKRKSTIIPKITLISGDKLSVTTLEEAQRLSKRRDLKLVKMIDLDTKTQRPVYKLMTGAEYHAEDLKQREQRKKERQNFAIKGEKVLMIGQNISEHDLQTNINKINKWLNKLYEVRVIINGSGTNMEKAEKVYNFMEKSLNPQVRFLQKRQKGSDIKFQIMPPKQSKDENDDKL